MPVFRKVLGWLAGAAFVAGSVAASAVTPQQMEEWARKYPPEVEQRVGKPVVDEADQQYGVVDDPAETQRIASMVEELAAVSDRPNVHYDVKIINADDPNAFAVPGGYVRVTRGLLDMAQSDHELAGVLAHELAHNCLYHGLRQLDRDKNLQQKYMAVLIAGLLLGGARNLVGLAQVDLALAVLRANILFGYSRDYESEADRTGLGYILKTHYNPTGFLTFMERLAAYEQRRWIPPPEMRSFDTHPPSQERASEILAILRQDGVTINRALVLRGFSAGVDAVDVQEGVRIWNVEFASRVIFQPASLPNGGSPEDRARSIAAKINDLVAAYGIATASIGVRKRGDRYAVTLAGRAVIQIYPEDAKALAVSEREAAQMTCDAFVSAVWEADLKARGAVG